MSAVTTRGIVNAIDPGMGKIVTTAASFAERAERVSGWRGLAVVPLGVLVQWRTELQTYFPASDVDIVYTASRPPPCTSESLRCRRGH